MVLASAAVDGVTNIVPGWTDQATSPYSSGLESYTGPSNTLFDPPQSNGYGAWTLIPEDAINTNAHTSTYGYLMRMFVPANFSCGHLDMICTANSGVTAAYFGLYSASSFATGPLVYTGEVHASIVASTTAPVALTWNGASSASSVNLIGGQTYWVYYTMTFSTSATLAGSVGTSVISMNPNLTASATSANNAMQLASAQSALAANTTLAPQTTWANYATKTWFGLRA